MSLKQPFSGAPKLRLLRGRTLVPVVFAVVMVVIPFLVGYYTDWLWFKEVHFTKVFTTVLVSRVLLFLVVGIITALVIWLSCAVVRWTAGKDLAVFDENNPLEAYRERVTQLLRQPFVVMIIAGILTGMFAQRQWEVVLLALSGGKFGVQDSQFGHDLGFYAFSLPLLQLVVSSVSMLLVASFAIALFGHYLLGGIRPGNTLSGTRSMISSGARMQLVVTAGLWVVVKVLGYALDRYSLLFTKHDTFTGGGYTDINAILPAKILLMVIGIVVAAAFFSAIVLKDLRIPVLATALMVLSSLVIGVAWPVMVEQFSVKPNRAEKERDYIGRNIEATRYAYGLTDENVRYEKNWGAEGATDEAVANDRATVSNIRLLDPEVLSATFTQMQQLRNFYGFPDQLSIDRYMDDGELRDYVVAARELDPNALSDNQKDWINRHTVYTHGNGFIAAPANQVDEVARDVGSSRGGYPIYNVSDLQAIQAGEHSNQVKKLGIEVEQPRTYYGPVISRTPESLDYAIVGNTDSDAVEYDTDADRFTYDGKGGVPVGNVVNRASFALKYRELNILLSERVGDNSKIIFNRDPRKRVEKVAPWLTTDSATYPAVIGGRIKWIVDGYTTLANLPYSEHMSLTDATKDALHPDGTSQRLFNPEVGYIRNSVKAVVDAYDGDVKLYAFDEKDPVLAAWMKAFPGTVSPKSEISEELMNHLRYPEDLFKVQRALMARYHVDDPGVFFNNDAFWSVPSDPTKEDTQKVLQNNGQPLDAEQSPSEREKPTRAQPPYYVVAADPETGKSSFQMITPFRGLKREFLAAHMSVSSDPETYGRITVRILPTNTQTLGPKQAQDTMISSDQISRDRSLWENTNKLIDGNLLTLPVGGGQILFVEPVYTQRKNQASAFPKLLRVLVSYNGKVGYAPTIAEALAQVGINPKEAVDLKDAQEAVPSEDLDQKDDSKDKGDEKAPTPALGAGARGDERAAIDRISKALDALHKAEDGTHEEYGRALDELDRAVKEYQSTYQK